MMDVINHCTEHKDDVTEQQVCVCERQRALSEQPRGRNGDKRAIQLSVRASGSEP
jgi:hypothetical protein